MTYVLERVKYFFFSPSRPFLGLSRGIQTQLGYLNHLKSISCPKDIPIVPTIKQLRWVVDLIDTTLCQPFLVQVIDVH
jgi:hypothetical protein